MCTWCPRDLSTREPRAVALGSAIHLWELSLGALFQSFDLRDHLLPCAVYGSHAVWWVSRRWCPVGGFWSSLCHSQPPFINSQGREYAGPLSRARSGHHTWLGHHCCPPSPCSPSYFLHRTCLMTHSETHTLNQFTNSHLLRTDLVGKVQEILNWLYTLCSQTKPLQRRKLFCTLDSKIFAKSQKQNTEAISSLHLLTIWIFLDAADVPGHRRKISDTAWELTPGQAVF